MVPFILKIYVSGDEYCICQNREGFTKKNVRAYGFQTFSISFIMTSFGLKQMLNYQNKYLLKIKMKKLKWKK